jgi:hypothetical protein
MNAKLIVEGKEFEIEILDPELQKLLALKKKTGYERVELGGRYWYESRTGYVQEVVNMNTVTDENIYDNANYYSDETVAENNARADNLMRQLRRFAVEHRQEPLDWLDDNRAIYCISYDYKLDSFLEVWGDVYTDRDFGVVYFDSYETAKLAMDTFKDELIWYFTEYKDSL